MLNKVTAINYNLHRFNLHAMFVKANPAANDKFRGGYFLILSRANVKIPL